MVADPSSGPAITVGRAVVTADGTRSRIT